jgi:hypothetical protein
VRLVDDVDLVAPFCLGGRVHGPLPQVARVVDAAVRRRVDLDHVERRLPAQIRSQLSHAARLAVAARLGQLSAIASTRASVVLPTPRGPQKR